MGILFNIIGPLAKDLKMEMLRLKAHSITNMVLEKKPVSKTKVFLYELGFRFAYLLFYPVFFAAMFIDYLRGKS